MQHAVEDILEIWATTHHNISGYCIHYILEYQTANSFFSRPYALQHTWIHLSHRTIAHVWINMNLAGLCVVNAVAMFKAQDGKYYHPHNHKQPPNTINQPYYMLVPSICASHILTINMHKSSPDHDTWYSVCRHPIRGLFLYRNSDACVYTTLDKLCPNPSYSETQCARCQSPKIQSRATHTRV